MVYAADIMLTELFFSRGCRLTWLEQGTVGVMVAGGKDGLAGSSGWMQIRSLIETQVLRAEQAHTHKSTEAFWGSTKSQRTFSLVDTSINLHGNPHPCLLWASSDTSCYEGLTPQVPACTPVVAQMERERNRESTQIWGFSTDSVQLYSFFFFFFAFP